MSSREHPAKPSAGRGAPSSAARARAVGAGARLEGAAGARRLRFGDREVVTHGLRRRVWHDLFHYFMTVSWPRLFATFALASLLFNLAFALLYRLQPGCLANLNPQGFWGAFFFSVETLATVGYGDMHPQTLYGHAVASVEIFFGLMSIALVTGVMFARFSRPTARFLFAEVVVVRPMDGRRMLMFRAANARQNIVMEASARLRLIRDSVTQEGYQFRRIEDLPLLRSDSALSPASGLDSSMTCIRFQPSTNSGCSLRSAHAILNLTLSGTDETTGQVLMTSHAYRADAIRWDHGFRDILATGIDGIDHVDYSKFHDADPL